MPDLTQLAPGIFHETPLHVRASRMLDRAGRPANGRWVTVIGRAGERIRLEPGSAG